MVNAGRRSSHGVGMKLSTKGRYAMVALTDLALQDGKLAFDVTTQDGRPAADFAISLGELSQVVKDYGKICASYYEAVRSKPPAEIEALDEARRAIHGEGATGLRARLAGHVEVDDETAKRLFTLLHALAMGG